MALDFKKAHAAVNSEWLNQVEEEKKTKAANTAKQKANYKSVKKTTGKSKNIAKTLPYNNTKDTTSTTDNKTPQSIPYNTNKHDVSGVTRETNEKQQYRSDYLVKKDYERSNAETIKVNDQAIKAGRLQMNQMANGIDTYLKTGSVVDRNADPIKYANTTDDYNYVASGNKAENYVKGFANTTIGSYMNAAAATMLSGKNVNVARSLSKQDYIGAMREIIAPIIQKKTGVNISQYDSNSPSPLQVMEQYVVSKTDMKQKAENLITKGQTQVDYSLKDAGSVGKFVGEAGQSVGGMVVDAGLGLLTGSGLVSMYVRSAGAAEKEARDKGYGETDSYLYGMAQGVKEAATEMLFGGVTKAIYGEGAVDTAEILAKKFTSRLANETTKSMTEKALKLGLSINEEGMEEAIADILDLGINKFILGETDERTAAEFIADTLYDYAQGAFASAVMGGAANVAGRVTNRNSTVAGTDDNTLTQSGNPIQQAEAQLNQLKTDAGINQTTSEDTTKEQIISEIETITEGLMPRAELENKSTEQLQSMLDDFRGVAKTETKQAKTDNASQWKEGDSYSYPGKNSPQDPAAYQYEVVSQGSDGKTRHTFFTDEKKAQANADNYNAMFGAGAAQVVNLQNEGELYNAVQQVTGNRAASQAESEAYLTQQTGKTADQLRAESENLFNQQQASINNNVQENYNENGGDIRQALQNTENKPKNIPYNYDLTTKEGRMAAKVTDEKTENQIAALSKVFKRNISFSTDFEEGVHGKHDLNTGDIVLNAASIKDGQSVTKIVLGHELTHGLEKTRAYKAMSNVIERYIDSQEGVTFREQVEKLRNSYQNEIKGMSDEEAYEYLKQEYIAEFAGNYIFNNEEFINRLCKEDRSTFERVKEWIQDTINKLTSKDEAYKMLTDARHLYDRAARQSAKQNKASDSKYSKGTVVKTVTPEEDKLYQQLTINPEKSKDRLANMVENAAKQAGYDSPKLYHGTGKFGFTSFDQSKMDDGLSIFTSINRKVAESYSGETEISKISEGTDVDYWDLANEELLEHVNKKVDSGYRLATQSELDNKNQVYLNTVKKTENLVEKFIYNNDLGDNEEEILWKIVRNLSDYQVAKTNEDIFRSSSEVNIALLDLMWENESLKFELMQEVLWDDYTKASNMLSQTLGIEPDNFFTKDGKNLKWAMEFVVELDNSKHGIYELYGNTDNMLTLDAEGANWNNIQFNDELISISNKESGNTRDVCKWAKALGYDGVIIKNVKDSGGNVTGAHFPEDEYIFFDPKKLKSADNVTYDNNNNIIPLSERFNNDKNELRYSQGEGLNANTEAEEKLYSKLGFNQNTDNEGRKLSKEQKQYFAQSKVRDDNGNLMTMYHGSAEQFDTFDIKKAKSSGTYGRGFYFTDSDSHAGQYGKRMEVYLNITDPLQHGTNNITKEQLTKYVQSISDDEDYGLDNYGYGATVDSVVNSVWGKDDFSMLLDLNVTAIGDMAEAVKLFNNVNGTNYDGIIAPTETVAFYPNQIKQVTNQNPTVNSNTKLSKGTGLNSETTEEEKLFNNLAKASETSKQFTGKGKKKVEAARNLIAVHNMTGEELAKTLKLGGLPMPSIAIIKAEMGHDMYGPVSLVFHKDSIDPKANKANKVYGADAYTPTYPQIDYKVNREALNAVYEDIAQQIQGTGLSASGIEYQDQVESRLSSWRGDYAEAFNNDEALKYAYLKEKGESVDVPQTEERLTSRYGNDDVKEIYDRIVDKNLIDEMASYKWYENNPETAEAIANVLNSKNNRAINEKGRAEKGSDWVDKWHEFYKPEDISFHDYDLIMRGVKKLNDNGGVINQTNDVYELKRLLNDTVKYNDPDFRQWINDKFQGVTEKEGIYNGKDLFTYSGNRRSWEALHYEHNLENVVKTMKNDISQGKGFGGMNLFGSSAEKLSNLNQVKEREGQLYTIPQEEYEAMRNDFTSRFNEITNEMTRGKGWQAQDDASNVLLEALTKYKTKSGMDSYIREQTKGWADYNSYMLDDFMDIVTGIRQMPTGYFEAKPERAMNIGEVATVIVPSDINPEILSQMNDYGLDVRTYKPGDEAERKQILNSLDELKFRKAAGLVADTEAEQKMYSDLERASQITSKKFQQQNIPYNRPAETVTPETTTPEEATVNTSNIQAPVQETRKAQEYTKRSGRNFRDNLLADLHITRWADSKAMKTYTDELQEKIKTGTLTEADKERLFMDILAEGEVINQDKADTYGDLVTDLKNRTFYVSRQTSNNITDYNAFRHDSKLKLSSKGGAAIDDIYQHSLQAKYGKEMFPDLNTPEEMLEQIDKVYKDATDVYTPLSQMSESQLDEAMTEYREKFDKAVEQLEKDLNIAKRYNDFRANKSTEETFNDYNQLNYYKKAAERVKNKVLLTDEDRADLKMLHKGTLTEEQLRTRNENADNVLKVYEAEKPVMQLQEQLKKQGDETHAKYREIAEGVLANSDNWKEKKAGIRFSTDTAERNMEDLAGMAEGFMINDNYFTPIHDNEAKSTRMKNDYRDEVRKLNISEKPVYNISKLTNIQSDELQAALQENGTDKDWKVSESALVQMYGEGLLDKTQLTELGADVEKIENAVATMRNYYEQMLDQANQVLILHGYEPIAHRQNYFPHFTETKPDSIIAEIGSALGFNVKKDELPTDIAGLTHTFKPGKKWFGNALERKGKRTEYDALEGFDRYVEGIGDVIFHTADIQKLRAFESELRYKYSEQGQKDRLDEINNNPNLSEIEKEAKRQAVYEAGMTKHGTLAQWIRRYTDTLAGKKSMSDREMEYQAGRKSYGIVKSLENRVAANMVALNPGSWLTNFIPLVQGSEVKNSNIIKGMAGAVQNLFQDDGFKDRSTFLTNRAGTDTLVSSNVEKITDTLTKPMEWIDTFTSQSLVRAKYLQGIQEGKEEWEAMEEADRFAANVIADRSKGSLPLIFESKNPLTKILTMYQVEVNNQWNHLFKDIPRTEGNVAKTAAAYAKFAIGAYIFNDVFEKVVGRRPALDPLSWLNDLAGDLTGKQVPNFIDAISATLSPDDDEEDENVLERLLAMFEADTTTAGNAVANLAGNVAEDLPFIGGVLGGGRVPIQSALPDVGEIVTNAADLISGDANSKKAWSNIANELSNPLTYIVPPVGGGQAKKVYQSTKDILAGGNYAINSKGEQQLRYAVDNTYENWIKGLLFGQYALEGGQEYIEGGYKQLNALGTTAYDALRKTGVKNSEAEAIIRDVNSGNKADKIAKLQAADLTAEQKNTVAEILDITSYKKEPVEYSDGPSVYEAPAETEETKEAENTTTSAAKTDNLTNKQQKYVDALTEAGLDTKTATDAAKSLKNYSVDYIKAATLMEKDYYTDDICEALGIDDKAIDRAKVIHDNGYDVFTVNKRWKAANADNKGAVTQEEAKNYLDKQNMSKKEKAAWWKILTGGSDKRNPYN